MNAQHRCTCSACDRECSTQIQLTAGGHFDRAAARLVLRRQLVQRVADAQRDGGGARVGEAHARAVVEQLGKRQHVQRRVVELGKRRLVGRFVRLDEQFVALRARAREQSGGGGGGGGERRTSSQRLAKRV